MLKAIITVLLMSTVAMANCKDDLKDFKRAQKYGAYNFKCKDNYDGHSGSSWTMTKEGLKNYTEDLLKSKRRSK